MGKCDLVGFVQFISVFLYSAYLFLPGYLIVRLIGVNQNRLVLSFTISFCFLILSQIPYRLTGGSIVVWHAFLYGTIALAIVGSCIIRNYGPRVAVSKTFSTGRAELIGLVAVVSGFSVYHLSVGPYTEIPSDFWAHLGQVVEEITLIDGASSREGMQLNVVLKEMTFVHFLHGAVAQALGVHPLLIVREATLVTSLVFLFVFYQFVLRVTNSLVAPSAARAVVAVLATVLMVASYGVSTFSYIRYYAYFPHILNFALALSSVLLTVDYLEGTKKSWLSFGLVGVLVGIMALVNRQEVIFALTLISGISIMRLLRTYSRLEGLSVEFVYQTRCVGYAFLVVILIGFVVTVLLRDPGVWVYPHVINLSSYLGLDWQLLIANPTMRFWDTLAPYGIVVYLWYITNLKLFKGADYIHVAMLSPLFTLLNPLFVWWFLHVASWDPLWRMALLMPLPIVGAVLIVQSFTVAKPFLVSSRFWFACTFSFVTLASLVPWDNSFFRNTWSRMPSLVSINQTNGEQLWWDLINVIDHIDGERRLVTDPVTHYVLSSSTIHRVKSPGKAGWQHNRDAFREDYKDPLLYYGMDGGIVIINERDGAPSKNGAWSGHWTENILAVSKRYPEGLKNFLETEVTEFRKIWANDSISAYEVLRNSDDY